MAHILSTGAKQALAETGSAREAFSQMMLEVYEGTPPTDADAAATGTKLVRITYGGSAAAAGTAKVDTVKVTHGTTADTFSCVINGVTITATETTDTDDSLAVKLAAAINASSENNNVQAIFVGGTNFTESGIIVWSRIPGLTFTHTVAKSSSGGTITLHENLQANARGTMLNWDQAADGVISKPSGDTWSGTALADGTAGYYRFVKVTDTAALSTTEVRLQGSCATAGAELNLSGSTSIATGAPVSVSSFSLTVKETV